MDWIDISIKIIIPISTLILGWFLGVHKERLHIKWQDKRQTLKNIYNEVLIFDKLIFDTEYKKADSLLKKIRHQMNSLSSKDKYYENVEDFYNAFYIAIGMIILLRDFEKKDFGEELEAEYEKIHSHAKMWLTFAVDKIEPLIKLLKKELE